MNFVAARDEMRERFAETSALLNYIRQHSPAGLEPLDSLQKATRGLWVVSLYAAFERGSNAVVEAAIEEISGHGARSVDCVPAIHSIVHFSKIQAVKDCGYGSVFDKSMILFNAAFSSDALPVFDNPLTERMMNVDGGTLKWLTKLFGAPELEVDRADLGRLSTLRERRNAVAHGRESASAVGERYTLDEMANLYSAADRVSAAFLILMTEHCTRKRYLRNAA